MTYLNEQMKSLYSVTDKDYVDWCKKSKKPMSSKKSVSDFIWRLMTERLVRGNDGKLKSKKKKKERPVR